MSILTKNKIINHLKKGKISVEPLDPNNIGPASIDLTLGNKFRVFKKSKKTLNVTDNTDYHTITKLVTTNSIVIKPNETILGITKEKITLAQNICGWLEGRSRFARLGLLVHISASFMQPGISNQQVLEISNMSNVPLKLTAGTKICQFIFQKTKGKASYHGKFTNQTEP